MKWGGAPTTVAGISLPSVAAIRDQREIRNAGATNSQKAFQGTTGGLGSTTGAILTATDDTQADVTITITGQLGTTTDTLTLENALVEVLYAA
ncbi:hypothetical protein ASD99_21925 [Mesorhizobium sp. Root695]|nr:hypothetical protein ASD12_26800 [Mesorhizobium sp. Root102]KRB30554.1 hypothetical protein ASD99_21925 [Mesorhizobium sp. Root695]